MLRPHFKRAFSLLTCIVLLAGSPAVSAQFLPDSTPAVNEPGDWGEWGDVFAPPGSDADAGITGDTYILPTSGTEVIVADGVTPTDPSETSFADQVLVSSPGGIGAVAVIQGIGYPLSVMEAYVGGFADSLESVEEVDVRTDRHYAAGLYAIDMSGVQTFMYITVDTRVSPGNFVIQVVVALDGQVGESIDLMRQNVSVDGVAMFADVDELEVQDLVDTFSGG